MEKKKKDHGIIMPVMALVLSVVGLWFLFNNPIVGDVLLIFAVFLANESRHGKFAIISWVALAIAGISLIVGLFSQLSQLVGLLKFFQEKGAEIMNNSLK